jgi:diguanylate cyclase (GGDEF)-like protein/PAS domain S-box-containing protein
MTGTVAGGPATSDRAGDAHVSALSDRAIWCFVAAGIAVSLLASALPTENARSFVFDACSLIAAGAAVYGILRNDPHRRGVWQLFALGLVLFAAGDVVFDTAIHLFGRADGYPYADVLYLLAYPILAFALVRLARARFDREIAIDSAIVAVALSAVIWQWVITPVLDTSHGATVAHIVAVAYPIMDILLVVVIVHAVFTLPRWTPAAWLLFAGLAVMLIADALYARLVADGTYTDGGALDALWPIAYFLLAAAVMHPSMRALWEGDEAGPIRHGRARMLVLGAALFAAPAVVLIDDSGSSAAVVLALIIGVAALGVAWRITRLVDESNHAREVLAESEARFRALVQHATDIITVITPAGRVQYISPAVANIFGRPLEDLLGSSFVDFLDDDGTQQGYALYETLIEHPDQPVATEFHVFDGTEWRWIEATWTNQLHEPAVRGIVGNLREITDRKRGAAFAEVETRVLELILSGAPVPETLTTLIEALEDSIPDGLGSIRLLDAEHGTLESVAAPSLPAEYVEAAGELSTVEDVNAFLSATELHVMRDIAAEGSQPAITELCLSYGLRGLWSAPIRTPDGSTFLGLLGFFLRTVRDPKPGELALLERVRDLAAVAIDRDARTKELGRLALHDTLTGLPNRALAQDRLEHALTRLRNGGDDAMVAVLFVDLDRFKLVNDGLGHETGDELLVAVSRRLSAAVRHQDTIARFGGDEFVVLCEDLSGEDQAVELAERAALAFAEPFVLSRAEVSVSASIGIAVTSRSSERAASLLQDADAAMYRAKKRGGARHELFDEAMHTQAVSRLLTERALRRALDRDELRVLFQPQFDLATGRRVAVEALLRWDHPVRGLVMPGDFLRVAEETGIIVPIGAWVLERACEILRSPNGNGSDRSPLGVSINVSTRQLQRGDFPSLVACAVRDSGIDPTTLCLEVAESALLDEIDTTSEALRMLKDLGVHLAIDDFGTGGSSLTYLRRFPFDELKIDRTFIEGLGRSAADDAIVAATIDMAHALDMVVTAEGVETEAQRVRLCELECDRAQGYHLGPPAELSPRRLVLVQQQPA